MEEAYRKVYKVIMESHYQHLKNGSVINLISNFYNTYRHEEMYKQLLSFYNQKLSLIENND